MDDLHVNNELATMVGDDQGTEAASATVECLRETLPEVGLVDDTDSLFNITSLSHGDNGAIVHVKDTVLLKDGTKHGLDNNTWAWVLNEAGLLMQLLGEEINTEVSVLASGRGGGDTDDLARTTLKDQEVTNADVVAWDGDSVGWVWRAIGGRRSRRDNAARWSTSRWGGDVDVNLFAVRWVDETVSGTGQAVAEGVVVALVVVVTHFLRWFLNTRRFDCLFSYLELIPLGDRQEARRVDSRLVDTGFLAIAGLETAALVETRRDVDGAVVHTDVLTKAWLEARGSVLDGLVDANWFTVGRLETRSKLAFSDINLRIRASSMAMMSMTGDVNFDVSCVGSVIRSEFLSHANLLSATRTVMTVLFTGDENFFLLELLLLRRRKIGGIGRVLVFPSEALCRCEDLTLDASLSGGGSGLDTGVAPVGRRKKAEGDRDSGVKVQVDRFLPVREILFSNAFRRAERKTRRGLLLLCG